MGLLDILATEGKKFIEDALPGGRLNSEWTPGRVKRAASAALDFVPVVGGVKGAKEEWEAGNPGWAAFNAASVPLDLASFGAGGAALKAGAAMLPMMGAVKGAKLPRMTRAEAEAAGYWHPIGDGKKLPVPIGEMKVDRSVAQDMTPWRRASPEAMQGGSLVPFPGDRSIAGQYLNGIGDVKFENPVYLEGGYDFMRTHAPTGAIWASEKGASRALQNQIDRAASVGNGNVFGVYSAMGPNSMNYNTMMADALLEQIRAGKVAKKSIREFDKTLKSVRPEWSGLLSDEARPMLEDNGALRHAFVDRMALDEFQDAGFPNIAYTRFAITDPKLLNEGMYSSGLAIGKMRPGASLISNPSMPHKTYDTQLAGDYLGGFDRSVPLEIMYPDFIKARRAAGAPVQGDIRSFQLAKPIQPANQEWVDGVMKYLEDRASLLDL